MKQLFLSVDNGDIRIVDTPCPVVRDKMVIVETLYSVVSAGTERTITSFGGKNLIQKALERPDQVKKVTEKISTDGILTTMEAAFGKLKEPMPMGYSGVGRVVETGSGVTKVSRGDLVAMAGQAYHSEVNRVGHNLVEKIPDGVEDIRQAAFCALGGIALEGIHQAEVIPGETVAVIGMGLLGHITARILYAYGCDVIGFDIADKTLPDTKLKAFINSSDDHAADMALSLTKGRGVDRVIITAAADSNAPIELSEAITRDRAVICMVGVTKMNLDRRPFYNKELSFKIARSYGAGRYDSSYEEDGVDYPVGYVRFTEGRNVEEFLRLLATKRLDISDLITHVFPFEKAPDAYGMLTDHSGHEKYIGILLEYKENPGKWQNTIRHTRPLSQKKTAGETINIGLIGAGNFARATLLPVMQETGLFHFRGLATTGGSASAQANGMFPFEYTTSDYRKLLGDERIDLIVISTQHNSHAKFIVEALESGKHVYCEKPLCLNTEELKCIRRAYENGNGELFCGLNRRHAPLVRQIRRTLQTDKIPAVYSYIANAGFIPAEHWVQDERKGGGRIVGEACHFIDTIQSLDGSRLTGMQVIFADNAAYPRKDNAVISLQFESGAVGTITYTSMGSKKYPKEQLRVFSNGTVCELNNYVSLTTYSANKHTETRLKQDKGIRNEYRYIAEVLRGERKNDSIMQALEAQEILLKELGK